MQRLSLFSEVYSKVNSRDSCLPGRLIKLPSQRTLSQHIIETQFKVDQIAVGFCSISQISGQKGHVRCSCWPQAPPNYFFYHEKISDSYGKFFKVIWDILQASLANYLSEKWIYLRVKVKYINYFY